LARPSWREFTAFDASNNILRNATSLIAGYIAGAHVVESLPYDLLLQKNASSPQASRLALTSQLVLQSEAGLSEVVDPSSGSAFIEELTRTMGEAAWQIMQKLSSLSESEKKKWLTLEAQAYWSDVQTKYRLRKLVQTGVNDFPLASEIVTLAQRWQQSDHVRLAREFEELRLSVKNKKITVAIAVIGDYAAMQARLNFSKNYFEILGADVFDSKKALTVAEGQAWLHQQKADVLVWVSSDEVHSELTSFGAQTFIAGKTEVEGCKNIFMGQNVYEVLSQLAQELKA
jgi:methylmalonyl-CoA mutase